MDGWMMELMDWTHKWMDRWMDGWTDEWLHVRICGWMDGCIQYSA